MKDFRESDGSTVVVEFSPGHGLQQVALKPGEAVRRSGEALRDAMNVIRSLAGRVQQTVGEMAEPPSRVEVAFGIKFDVQAGAIVARTELESSINVKLTWESGPHHGR